MQFRSKEQSGSLYFTPFYLTTSNSIANIAFTTPIILQIFNHNMLNHYYIYYFIDTETILYCSSINTTLNSSSSRTETFHRPIPCSWTFWVVRSCRSRLSLQLKFERSMISHIYLIIKNSPICSAAASRAKFFGPVDSVPSVCDGDPPEDRRNASD